MKFLNKLFSSFFTPKRSTPVTKFTAEGKPAPIAWRITLQDYATRSPIPDKLYPNAKELLRRVNLLLEEIDHLHPTVTSGYRNPDHNQLVGGAPGSAHKSAQAVDILDIDGYLKTAITPKLLEKYDLYMEHPIHTPTWVHLQSRPVRSGNRQFYIK